MDNRKNAPAPVSRLLVLGDLNARARSPTALTVARKMRDNLPTLTIAKKAILFYLMHKPLAAGTVLCWLQCTELTRSPTREIHLSLLLTE